MDNAQTSSWSVYWFLFFDALLGKCMGLGHCFWYIYSYFYLVPSSFIQSSHHILTFSPWPYPSVSGRISIYGSKRNELDSRNSLVSQWPHALEACLSCLSRCLPCLILNYLGILRCMIAVSTWCPSLNYFWAASFPYEETVIMDYRTQLKSMCSNLIVELCSSAVIKLA